MTTDVPRADEAPGDGVGRKRMGERVLVPVLDATTGGRAVEVGGAIAQARGGELLVVGLDVGGGPEPRSLLHPEESAHDRQLAHLVERARGAVDVPVRDERRTGIRAPQVLSSVVDERDVDTVVVEGPERGQEGRFTASTVEQIEAKVDCDVVAVNGEPPLGTVSSVLLAVAGGPHSWLAAGVAGEVAAAEGAWVDVVHVVTPGADDWHRVRGRRIIDTAMDRLDEEAADVWLHEADDVVDALVEQSRYYDLTVMGAPRKSRLQRFVSGSTARDVRRDADNAVVTVRRAGERGSLLGNLVR